MPEHTEFDPTDKGTLRPNAPLISKPGDKFDPMQLPPFHPRINLPDSIDPDNPISIFTMYYTPEIIDEIVENTNSYIREPQDDL